ncbi:MAG: hypothetical protein RBT25_08010 [Lentisphaeria bacterium]|nr:hypothetical protein [Lentisphaeria bacterium]
MKTRLLLLLALLCALPVFCQDADQVLDKLNKGQRKHYLIFRQIQIATRAGKAGQKKVFEAYYAPIAQSCEKSQPQYQKQAEKLQERSDNALAEGKDELSQRLLKEARFYFAISQAQLDIIKAYTDNNTAAMRNAMKLMQSAEVAMRTNRLKLLERDWLLPTEAEKILIATGGRK